MRMNFWRAFWGIVLVLVGLFYLLDNFGFIDFSLWWIFAKLWPVILIIVGLVILITRRNRYTTVYSGEKKEIDRFIGDIRLQGPLKDIDGTRVSNFIGDIDITVTEGESFEGVCHMHVSSFIADTAVAVPRSIPVMVEHSAFIGNIKTAGEADLLATGKGYRSSDYDGSTKKLYIRASVFIGDLRIILT